jgi:hypothetical protein
MLGRMKRLLAMPFVQIALCFAVYGLLVWRMGPAVAVWSSPLLAAAIARPVLSLIADVHHGVRSHIWLPVHGQHYVFKGVTIRVEEDEDHARWICLADARKVVATIASERALAITFTTRLKGMGQPAQPHLRDDALIEHLGKESNPVALRFRTWIERDIAFPGRRIRKNYGIHLEA